MTIHIATAPVAWGIYEFEGIAPKYPYARVLDEMVETGYDGLELGPWGFLPTDADRLREELARRGLRLLSSYVPVALRNEADHERGEAFALQVGRLLAALGAQYVVLADDNGTVPELVQRAGKRSGSMLSAEEWDVFARGVNRIARRVFDELGLQTVFHHHCAGYVETPEETAALMARVDPDLVGLCLDTGHWHFAGGDAVACIREYGQRVRYLHLKDMSAAVKQRVLDEDLDYFGAMAAGIFPRLGHGVVDFAGVLSAMAALGYGGWAVVEQDVLVDDLDVPKRYAAENRAYLRQLGY